MALTTLPTITDTSINAYTRIYGHRILVDWDNSEAKDKYGILSADIADITDDVIDFRITQKMEGEIGTYPASDFSIVIDNSDGKYTFLNSSSPLYNKIKVGLLVQVLLQVKWAGSVPQNATLDFEDYPEEINKDFYRMFEGRISLQPNQNAIVYDNQNQNIILYGRDLTEALIDYKGWDSPLYENKTAIELIKLLVNEGQNLIQNPSFEDWDNDIPKNWAILNTADMQKSNNAYFGYSAVELFQAGSNTPSLISDIFYLPLTESSGFGLPSLLSYDFKYNVDTTQLVGNLIVKLKYYDYQQQFLREDTINTINIQQSFTEYSYTIDNFNTPSYTEYIQVIFELDTLNSFIFIDDCSIIDTRSQLNDNLISSNWNFSFWDNPSKLQNYTASLHLTQEISDFISSPYSAKFVFNPSTYPYGAWLSYDNYVYVRNDSDYELFISTKKTENLADSNIGIGLVFFDENSVRLGQYTFTEQDINLNWEEKRFFISKDLFPANTSKIKILILLDSPYGILNNILLDDFKFYRIYPNLLLNGNFEKWKNEVPENWNIQILSSVYQEDTTKIEGSYSAKLGLAIAGFEAKLKTNYINIIENMKYNFSFYANNNNFDTGDTLEVGIFEYDKDLNELSNKVLQSYGQNTDYTRYDFILNPSDIDNDNTEFIRFYFEVNSANYKNSIIDGVQLVENENVQTFVPYYNEFPKDASRPSLKLSPQSSQLTLSRHNEKIDLSRFIITLYLFAQGVEPISNELDLIDMTEMFITNGNFSVFNSSVNDNKCGLLFVVNIAINAYFELVAGRETEGTSNTLNFIERYCFINVDSFFGLYTLFQNGDHSDGRQVYIS